MDILADCRPYHKEGMVKDLFHLTRANYRQRDVLSEVFGVSVKIHYTECRFRPDIELSFTGREWGWVGQLDNHLGDFPALGRWLAGQRSFEAIKC